MLWGTVDCISLWDGLVSDFEANRVEIRGDDVTPLLLNMPDSDRPELHKSVVRTQQLSLH
ncbi:hypothetical protein AKJ16_DCAP19027 [Drosera capensis]